MTPTTLATAAGAVTTAAALFLAVLPSQMEVSRTAVVHGSPDQVVHLVSNFPERRAWVAWAEIDPEADYVFTGTPGAPGATMAWEGEVIGNATLTLERVGAAEVVSRLEYTAPFQMVTEDHFTIEDLGDGTSRVTWTARGDLPYGPGRLFGLIADGELGPDYEWGLQRLDETLNRS